MLKQASTRYGRSDSERGQWSQGRGDQSAVFGATVSNAGELVPDKLWSLWDMLQSYFPIYKIALDLQRLRRNAEVYRDSNPRVDSFDAETFQALIKEIHRECLALGLTPTYEMAERLIDKAPPATYAILFADLDHLDGSLITDLKKEAVFRIPPERKEYFEHSELFGPKVSSAFPSCARDIQKAGSCYAIEQEDACVHHLMMVLERGLKALAKTVGLPKHHHSNWQAVITKVETQTNTLPGGPQLDFYRDVNAQFGFLKVAYRNHSEHAHDDPYDMEKALHILNHTKFFMQALEKGGVSE